MLCHQTSILVINLFEMSLKLDERVPLSKLQIIEEMSSPLQRKAKIYSRRLPEDFFGQRGTPLQQCRNETYSQRLPRRVSNIERPSVTRELNSRPVCLTSRKSGPDDTMDLLRGVIATSREMRKMIRRHSL